MSEYLKFWGAKTLLEISPLLIIAAIFLIVVVYAYLDTFVRRMWRLVQDGAGLGEKEEEQP